MVNDLQNYQKLQDYIYLTVFQLVSRLKNIVFLWCQTQKIVKMIICNDTRRIEINKTIIFLLCKVKYAAKAHDLRSQRKLFYCRNVILLKPVIFHNKN